MTIKEVAEIAVVCPETIKDGVRTLFPGLMRLGHPTVLNEAQVTAVLELRKKIQDASVKRKKCTDCLYCKQSNSSSWLIISAFCAKKPERKDRNLDYWETKKVCKFYEDMGYEEMGIE
jgi:hypothetical protein